jgi:hypothetical protein
MAATPAALAGLAIATTAAFGAAGQPVAQQELLCGTIMPAADNFSGASDIDHPDGSTSTGKTYPYANQDCENPGSSDGNYQWTITHSNVHAQEAGTSPQAERGTEHVQFALTNGQQAGAQGRITNFDLSANDNTGDPCGSNRVVYYASGHQYDEAGSCSPSSVGNFNTHGGAATGEHFRGNYGTVIYQRNDNNTDNPCKTGSMNYCFEAILVGQTN